MNPGLNLNSHKLIHETIKSADLEKIKVCNKIAQKFIFLRCQQNQSNYVKLWQSHCYISKKHKQFYVKSNQL